MNLRFCNKFLVVTLALFAISVNLYAYSDLVQEDFESVTIGQLPQDWVDGSDPNAFSVQLIDGSNRAALGSSANSNYSIATYDGFLAGDNSSESMGSFSSRATVTSQYWTTTGSWFGIVGHVQQNGSAYGVRLQGRGTLTGAWLETFMIHSDGTVEMLTRGGTAFDGALKPNSLTELCLSITNDDLNQVTKIIGRCRDNDGAGSVSRYQEISIPYGDAKDIGRAGKFGIVAGGNGVGNLGYTWDNIRIEYDIDGVRAKPLFLAHFNDDGTFGHLGDGFYRSGASQLFYPSLAAVDSTDNITYDYNGKYYGAIEVDDSGAAYQTYSHYNANEGAVSTTSFWWKPNFPKPTGTENISVRIWEWESEIDTERFWLEYKYRGSDGAEYILFRAPTGATSGVTTNSAPAINAVDFNDYNFIAFRWVNFVNENDRIGVKLNGLAMTYKEVTADQIDNVTPSDRFVIKNGSFDELAIREESMDNDQAEADRLLGHEYDPDSVPENCEEAKAMYGQFKTDFDGNCHVGIEDFLVIVEDWLKCYDPIDLSCETPWID